jgi:hypothetical protein
VVEKLVQLLWVLCAVVRAVLVFQFNSQGLRVGSIQLLLCCVLFQVELHIVRRAVVIQMHVHLKFNQVRLWHLLIHWVLVVVRHVFKIKLA